MRSDLDACQSPAAPPRVPHCLAPRRKEPAAEPLGSAVRRTLASLALAALVGCATAHVSNPLTRTLAASTPEAQGEFWYRLASRPVASNDEVFHALLLYADGKDTAADFTGRVAALSARHMLPNGFQGSPDDAVDRGTLAVALDQLLHIRGGLTMQLFGSSPRYALRAAVDKGIFPPSSPNQGLSGGEFVGVMQKAEEFEHGNPADHPVTDQPDRRVAMARPAEPIDPTRPVVYLDADATPTTSAAVAAAAAQGPVHLRAIVTGIQGDLAEIRPGPTAAWRRARPGIVMSEGTEIRTGPKSAIRFLIPADEAFCLDSQGAITLDQAVMDARHAKTRMGLEHGRLREDLSHAAPVQIEQAGIEHDTVIQSPNSALALRGTKVSLFEQASFAPVAVSLTGQATFTNVNGIRVPVGGTRHAVVVGAQTSAAQQAGAVEGQIQNTGNTARLDFAARELAIVTQRGGFQRGDVIAGDLTLGDFGTRADGTPRLPGGLDFVLQWPPSTDASKVTALHDLNLAVFSPLNTTATPDFVANAPFTVSLTPNSPTAVQLRKTTYPQRSASGGRISTNSVGPRGLELASWPTAFPAGQYRVVVYNLVDATHPPTTTVDPVAYTLEVFERGNGTTLRSVSGTLGELQTSPVYTFDVPFATTVTSPARTPRAAVKRVANASSPVGKRAAK